MPRRVSMVILVALFLTSLSAFGQTPPDPSTSAPAAPLAASAPVPETTPAMAEPAKAEPVAAADAAKPAAEKPATAPAPEGASRSTTVVIGIIVLLLLVVLVVLGTKKQE